MACIIFIILTIVCAMGWLLRFVSCLALLLYMESRDYEKPTDGDMRFFSTLVWDRLLHRTNY